MLDNFENINQRIQHIREIKHRSLSECAVILGITTEDYADIEKGTVLPSLPQIELLAIFFDIPSEKLLLDQPFTDDEQLLILNDEIRPRFIDLRNKMISATLKMTRENRQIAIEDIHRATQIPIDLLEAYEKPEKPIPIDHLYKMASVLELPVAAILEQVWLSKTINNDQQPKVDWEPEYPPQETEITQSETDPDQILLDAMRKIPVEVQAQIAKIILNNLKT